MSAAAKYRAAFSQSVQAAMEYRSDFLLSLLSGSFAVVAQCFLWSSVYGGGGSRFGYDYAQMIVYVVLAGVLGRLMVTGFEREIAEDIKSGGLSRYLVQPIGYFPYRVASFFGQKTAQLLFVAAIALALMGAMSASLGVSFADARLWWLVIVLPASLTLNCVLFYCLSMVAFWTTEASAVFTGIGLVTSIISGGVFPLDVLGEGAMRVSALLPFQYVTYFPLNIINGRYQTGDVLHGLLMQAVWTVLLFALSRVLWRAGMKRYIAAGG